MSPLALLSSVEIRPLSPPLFLEPGRLRKKYSGQNQAHGGMQRIAICKSDPFVYTSLQTLVIFLGTLEQE